MRVQIFLAVSLISATACAAKEPAADTYAPYVRNKGYEKTFKKWGNAGIARINEYRRKAAFSAANSPTCDNVEYADLSDQRSSPPNTIVIFVDCTNGQRFYLSNVELDNQTNAVSNQTKTARLNDVALIEACELAVRQSLRFPSSLDKSWFTTRVERAQGGNVAVTFDFSAKNALGLSLPQRARCITDDRGMSAPEISDR
ncbi:hypothetical protein GN325_20725 [Agrobacterium vitis]|uniref:hypothetical protein n=1 Tax=Agrobacterium vitis TaxID=373 RepID=UPI0012E88EFE|nr:hypothetical protein [Agrobacterium vitis]MVB04192.1 hypothetical protein [Agrobacterium vitis]